MIWIYMIITSLAMTALAKGHVECNFTEITETNPCFGELGKSLIFYLPMKTNTRKTLTHEGSVIINIVNDSEESSTGIKEKKRFAFSNDGTLSLNKTTKEDSGAYMLETHDFVSGRLLYTTVIQLEIQAPVSKPAVSQTCLSPEQTKICCSSEGDGAEFILHLDNNLLIHSKATAKHNVSNVIVSLYGQLTGNLTCDVQNNISREQTVIQLTICSTSGNNCAVLLVTAAVRASAAVLLLLLSLSLVLSFTYFKSRRSMTVKYDVAEQEITYSDK